MRRANSVGSIQTPSPLARRGTAHPAPRGNPGPSGPDRGQGAGDGEGAGPCWTPLDRPLQHLLPLRLRLRHASQRYVCFGAGGRLEIWGRRVHRTTAWLERARRVLRLLDAGPEREIDRVLSAVPIDLSVWGRLAVVPQGAAARIGGEGEACMAVLKALLACPQRGVALACRLFTRLAPALQWQLLQQHEPVIELIDRGLNEEQARILNGLDARQGGADGPVMWRERRACIQLQQDLHNTCTALCTQAAGQRDWARLALVVERCPSWALKAVLQTAAFETFHLGLDALAWAEPRLGRAIWARRLQTSPGERARFAVGQPFWVNPRLSWLYLKIEHSARFAPEREHQAVLLALDELAQAARSGRRRATQDLADCLLQLARTGWSPLALAMGLLMLAPGDALHRRAALQALHRAAQQALDGHEAAIAEAFAEAGRACPPAGGDEQEDR